MADPLAPVMEALDPGAVREYIRSLGVLLLDLSANDVAKLIEDNRSAVDKFATDPQEPTLFLQRSTQDGQESALGMLRAWTRKFFQTRSDPDSCLLE